VLLLLLTDDAVPEMSTMSEYTAPPAAIGKASAPAMTVDMNSYSAPPMTIDTNDDYAGLFMELTLQKKIGCNCCCNCCCCL
jgi:hypothetical protein